VLLLLAVGALWFALQEKKQADKAAARARTEEDRSWIEGAKLNSARVLSVAWSPDGKILASGSDDQTVKLPDGAVGKPLASLQGYTGDVYSVAWSPDGKTLATGSDDQTVKLWEAATGKLLSSLQGHTGAVYSVAWSPDGTTLATGSDDRTVKLWDAAAGKERL
jgi:WD40 repeat protein